MDLVTGQTYKRTALHAEFGGQQQGGISTPRASPVVLIFTGESGRVYGYHDGFQPDGMFWYTGEGQIGDMQWARRNAAIRGADRDGRTIHVFAEDAAAHVRYLGVAQCVGHHAARGPDREGRERAVIVIHLAFERTGAPGAAGVAPDLRPPGERRPRPPRPESAARRARTFAELRARAHEAAPAAATADERRVQVRRRSEAVRAYVLARAAGVCEASDAPAPFRRGDGTPYLEPHHIRQLSDDGPDHPAWVGAVCPACHREIHHGEHGPAKNAALAVRVARQEASLADTGV